MAARAFKYAMKKKGIFLTFYYDFIIIFETAAVELTVTTITAAHTELSFGRE
jgi:hypothetical protein